MSDIPVTPPFGTPIIWGKRGTGKTVLTLNSPWQPVHVLDVEDGARDYEEHMDRLIVSGLIPAKFTRDFCPDWDAWRKAIHRITNSVKGLPPIPGYKPVHYGTISIDTVGQWGEWAKTAAFSQPNAEKLSQITWGKIRDYLRSTILELKNHCDFVILTAHQREYPTGIFSPRANPAILELTSLSIQLTKQRNQLVPDGIIDYTRLPFLPQRISPMTWQKLLSYVEKPADWNNLSESEKAPPEEQPRPAPATAEDDVPPEN
jgi:hypothetical protein